MSSQSVVLRSLARSPCLSGAWVEALDQFPPRRSGTQYLTDPNRLKVTGGGMTCLGSPSIERWGRYILGFELTSLLLALFFAWWGLDFSYTGLLKHHWGSVPRPDSATIWVKGITNTYRINETNVCTWDRIGVSTWRPFQVIYDRVRPTRFVVLPANYQTSNYKKQYPSCLKSKA